MGKITRGMGPRKRGGDPFFHKHGAGIRQSVPFNFRAIDRSPDLFSPQQWRLHLCICVYMCRQISASVTDGRIYVHFFFFFSERCDSSLQVEGRRKCIYYLNSRKGPGQLRQSVSPGIMMVWKFGLLRIIG